MTLDLILYICEYIYDVLNIGYRVWCIYVGGYERQRDTIVQVTAAHATTIAKGILSDK